MPNAAKRSAAVVSTSTSSQTAVRRLLLGGLANLCLGGAAHLLATVALLLALLARLLHLQVQTVTLQTVLGLELLGKVQRVVDQREAGRLAAAEVGAEAEHEAHVGGDLVHGSQLLADVLLVHRRQAGVQHIADHLLAAQQTVRHELAGANGGRGCGHVDSVWGTQRGEEFGC